MEWKKIASMEYEKIVFHSIPCLDEQRYYTFACRLCLMRNNFYQRWSRGHKARGQGQGHKKKSEAKAKDNLSEDRTSRGQGQECSRPRPRTEDTGASVLQKKKKRLQQFFLGDLQFIGVPKIFDWGRSKPQIT